MRVQTEGSDEGLAAGDVATVVIMAPGVPGTSGSIGVSRAAIASIESAFRSDGPRFAKLADNLELAEQGDQYIVSANGLRYVLADIAALQTFADALQQCALLAGIKLPA